MKVTNGKYEIIHSGSYLITESNNSISFDDNFHLNMVFIKEERPNDKGEMSTWVDSKINNGLTISLYNFFSHDSANSKGFSRFFRKPIVNNGGFESYYMAFTTQKLSPTSISLVVNIATVIEPPSEKNSGE